jgi:hypothetical protein
VQGARASLDDLAMRWESPRGLELKAEVILDVTRNGGRGLERILKGFIYTEEVPRKADMRCISFADEPLDDAQFLRADLSWASFEGSSLERACFTGCTLKRADLRKSRLSLARFSESDCSRSDFTGSDLSHANLRETKLNGSRFLEVDASRCSFEGASLTRTNFHGAQLQQANFNNADCSNANIPRDAWKVVAARPSKAEGVRHEQSLDSFEREVGVKAMGCRSSRVFKGLDLLRQAAELKKPPLRRDTSSSEKLDPNRRDLPEHVGRTPEQLRGAPPSQDFDEALKRLAAGRGQITRIIVETGSSTRVVYDNI